MTKATNQLSLIDIENDFTEEEEAMFQTSPKRSVGMTTQPAMPTMEEAIVAKYKAGMPVTRLMRQYGMSTTILYKILNEYGVPLRGARNGSTVSKEFGETTVTPSKAPVNTDTKEATKLRTITINVPISLETTTLVINLEGGNN